MANRNDFIAYLNEQVENHSIYVWGAQGQTGATITEKWIKNRETSDANANRAIKFWKKQVEAGYGDVLRAFDCSGLGMYWLQSIAQICKSDMNANGMRGKCKKITKAELQPGDFVFIVNSSGRATHVGYVVDTDLNVVEARGRDYGVVKGKLSSRWNTYGRPHYWDDEAIPVAPAEPEKTVGYVFTRVLKYGRIGEDVCELKKLLKAAGFGETLTVTNRNFYGETKAAVKAFQKANGLDTDGKAGILTISALGGIWNP